MFKLPSHQYCELFSSGVFYFGNSLMGYVRKRRYELENPTPTQQESTPDYLLVDGF